MEEQNIDTFRAWAEEAARRQQESEREKDRILNSYDPGNPGIRTLLAQFQANIDERRRVQEMVVADNQEIARVAREEVQERGRENQELRLQDARKQARIDELIDARDNLQGQIEGLQQTNEEAARVARQQIEELTTASDELIGARDNLQGVIDGLQRREEWLTEQNEELTASRNDLREENDTAMASLHDLQGELRTVTNDRDETRVLFGQVVQATKTESENLHRQVERLERTIEGQKTETMAILREKFGEPQDE